MTDKVKHSIEYLQGLAEEMNDVMGLEPEIDTKLGYQELLDTIKANMEEVQAGREEEEMDDREEFTEHAWNMLADLGCDAAKEVPYYDNEAEEDEEVESEGESDEEFEEENSEEAVEDEEESHSEIDDIKNEIRETKKLKDIKNLVEFYSDRFPDIHENLNQYSGLQGTRQLKDDLFAVLDGNTPNIKVETEVESESTPESKVESEPETNTQMNDVEVEKEKPKSSEYSRVQSFFDAIDELCGSGATRKDLLKKANEKYDNERGTNTKSNPTNIAASVLASLTYYGILEYIDGKYVFKN